MDYNNQAPQTILAKIKKNLRGYLCFNEYVTAYDGLDHFTTSPLSFRMFNTLVNQYFSLSKF